MHYLQRNLHYLRKHNSASSLTLQHKTTKKLHDNEQLFEKIKD